jgi:hypothetical protein
MIPMLLSILLDKTLSFKRGKTTIDNEMQLLLTNYCGGKPNVVETFPLWLSLKE